jgi:uncharacterized hydrophobic protein (TIGR00271 family)
MEDEPFLEQLLRSTPKKLGILFGKISKEPLHPIVAAGTRPNAIAALQLADSLTAADTPLRIVRATLRSDEDESDEEELLKSLLEKHTPRNRVETAVVKGANEQRALLEAAKSSDLLMLGASEDPILKQATLSGLPRTIALARRGASLIVKQPETAPSYLLRKAWQAFSDPFPNLTDRERTAVYSGMRHSARADIDFYVLMFLASLIATMGLLLNSSAVIIGAMLVAPLMSPILAIAHGIVHGNEYMIRRGFSSSFRGVLTAVGIAAVVTALLPEFAVTPEILARTEPSLLDLIVALCAGVAAAYGVCRKSVAAALPGVAISVSLVPPLCVTGYGIGSNDFGIAAGSFLLFVTNFCSVVLFGALVFLLLGFRPSQNAQSGKVKQGMIGVTASLIILLIPLTLTTSQTLRKGRLEAKIASLFRTNLAKDLRLVSVDIEQQGSVWVVDAVVFAYRRFSPEYVEKSRVFLSEAVGAPVEINATLISAQKLTATASSTASYSASDTKESANSIPKSTKIFTNEDIPKARPN